MLEFATPTFIIEPKKPQLLTVVFYELRGPDLNQRPSGYEPDELPDCSTPRHYLLFSLLILSFPLNKKRVNGRRRIRTFESWANRFTVCPLWPLGNPPIKADERTRTVNLLITSQLLCQLSHIGIFRINRLLPINLKQMTKQFVMFALQTLNCDSPLQIKIKPKFYLLFIYQNMIVLDYLSFNIYFKIESGSLCTEWNLTVTLVTGFWLCQKC